MDIEKFYETGIEILEPVSTRNDFGEYEVAYSVKKAISGKIRPLSGNERYISGSRHQESTHRLYCSFDEYGEMDSEHKIKDDEGTEYNVVFVGNPMNFDKWLQVDLDVVE